MKHPELEHISPCWIVTDVERTIAFYRDHLGFQTRLLQPARSPFFAIIGRQNVQLFLKSEAGVSPVPNATRHHHLRWDAFIYAADPDALTSEFAAAATPFLTTLGDTHDGLRGFEIADPDGYILFFGRPQ